MYDISYSLLSTLPGIGVNGSGQTRLRENELLAWLQKKLEAGSVVAITSIRKLETKNVS